jgi:hypothetical protein
MKKLESGECSCQLTPQEVDHGFCPKCKPGAQIAYGSLLKEKGVSGCEITYRMFPDCEINSRIFPIGSLCFVMRKTRERKDILICESVGSNRVRGVFFLNSQIIKAVTFSRNPRQDLLDKIDLP